MAATLVNDPVLARFRQALDDMCCMGRVLAEMLMRAPIMMLPSFCATWLTGSQRWTGSLTLMIVPSVRGYFAALHPMLEVSVTFLRYRDCVELGRQIEPLIRKERQYSQGGLFG